MSADANAPAKAGSKLFGVAGVLMGLCCLAGPAVVGVAGGAAIGNLLGIAAAIVIAVACWFLLRRLRGRTKTC